MAKFRSIPFSRAEAYWKFDALSSYLVYDPKVSKEKLSRRFSTRLCKSGYNCCKNLSHIYSESTKKVQSSDMWLKFLRQTYSDLQSRIEKRRVIFVSTTKRVNIGSLIRQTAGQGCRTTFNEVITGNFPEQI